MQDAQGQHEGQRRGLALQRKPLAILELWIAASRAPNPAFQTMMKTGKDLSIQPITPSEPVGDFSCGVQELDDALRRDAERPSRDEPFTTYIAHSDGRIAGFYRLRRSRIDCVFANGAPDDAVPPLPIVELPRIAVDRRFQRAGLGTALLADALRRSLGACDAIGAGALFVHALSDAERPFYERHGLWPVPAMIDPLGFVAPAAEIRRALVL